METMSAQLSGERSCWCTAEFSQVLFSGPDKSSKISSQNLPMDLPMAGLEPISAIPHLGQLRSCCSVRSAGIYPQGFGFLQHRDEDSCPWGGQWCP